jgi:hypothetical protein
MWPAAATGGRVRIGASLIPGRGGFCEVDYKAEGDLLAAVADWRIGRAEATP